MHPRVSVSGVSSWHWSLDEELAFYQDEGVTTMGLAQAKLGPVPPDTAVQSVVRSGVTVGNVLDVGPVRLDQPEGWRDHQQRLRDTLVLADRIDAPLLALTTGCAGRLEWEVAAEAFATAIGPVQATAEHLGLVLALEHTNSLRTDVSFVHRLRDAVDLAHRLGLGVCLEVNACWAERGLAATIRDGIDVIRLVQVSDAAIGTTSTPDRLVPGDGDIPLVRILGQLLEAGYEGRFDIEIVGPRIEAEGYRSAIHRSVAYLGALLTDLGG